MPCILFQYRVSPRTGTRTIKWNFAGLIQDGAHSATAWKWLVTWSSIAQEEMLEEPCGLDYSESSTLPTKAPVGQFCCDIAWTNARPDIYMSCDHHPLTCILEVEIPPLPPGALGGSSSCRDPELQQL